MLGLGFFEERDFGQGLWWKVMTTVPAPFVNVKSRGVRRGRSFLLNSGSLELGSPS